MTKQGRTAWTAPLAFWDVPAALVGLAVAGGLQRVPIGHLGGVIWIGAPVAFVAARRALLPQLSPSRNEPRPEITLGRKIGAYVCMIVGGFFVLLGGLFFYGAATDERQPVFAWPFLLVAAAGGALASWGVRRVT
jgi:hypothetical protein